MTIRFHPVVIIALLIGVAFLIYALLRGCSNSRAALAGGKHLDSVIVKLRQDSVNAAYNAHEYETRLELLEGQIALWQNIAFTKNDSLMAANTRVIELITKHKPQKPNLDTTITTVPNEYVQDCEGCFTELSKDRDLVLRYRSSADSLWVAYAQKNNLNDGRILQLSNEVSNLQLTLKDAVAVGKRMESDNKPHWKLLFSVSTLWLPKINNTTGSTVLPNGAGIGFGYQDRYNRIVAGKYFTTEVGPVKQLDVYLPLSFRRKKD